MALHYLRVALLLIVPFVSGLIMPMTKPNGEADIGSIISHVTLMEQTITTLQSQVQTSNTELTAVKDKLHITSKELQSSKDEITAVKAELRLAEDDINRLQLNLQKRPDPLEFANLKTEFESLKVSHNSLVKQINLTVIDSFSAYVKSSMRDMQALNSELLTTKSEVNKTVQQVGYMATKMLGTNAKLNQTIRDLELNKAYLAVSKSDINQTIQDLLSMKVDLAANKADLAASNSKINHTIQDLQSMKVGLAASNSKIDQTIQDLQLNKVDLAVSNSKINQTIQDLQLNKVDLAASKLKINQTIQDLQSNKADLAANKVLLQSTASSVQGVQTQVSFVTRNLDSLRGNISAMKSKTDVDVAFQVTQRAKSQSAGWTALKFDTVDYNTGGGYSNISGMFIAPVSGTYIFWANVMYRSPATQIYINIKKGQQLLATGYYMTGDASGIGVASTMTVTHLDKGDQVNFTTSTTNDYIWGDGYSSYGGALLHAV